MARPKTFDAGSRVHVGIRYTKSFIEEFDAIASRQGLTRNQAVDWCLRDAIKRGRIPDFVRIDSDGSTAGGYLKEGLGARVSERHEG